jgi:enoyl-CoA hydratase/carnithine racemase
VTTVLLEQRDGIATVTLNRPDRLNAINRALLDDLIRTLDIVMKAPDVGVVILTGAGNRAFCAGDDLREPHAAQPAEARRQIEQIQEVTRLIMFEDKPVIAAVNGWAVGGGLEWVMNCDLSIWSEEARAFMPEVSLGLGVTGGVTSLLPRLVGWQRAKSLFFLGEKHSAARMLELGLAHAVVPADRVMPEAMALGRRLAAQPQAALRALKRAIVKVHRGEIERAMAAETEALVALFADPGLTNRLAAFKTS